MDVTATFRETPTMKTTTAFLLAGSVIAGAFLASLPARADVFSSQGFSGEETTLNALPGVNLDLSAGGALGAQNCVEVDAPSFTAGRRTLHGAKATECRIGNNFTITTTRSGGTGAYINNVYGDNPPPWAEGWRP